MSRIDYREAVLFRKKEYNRNGWNVRCDCIKR